MGCALWEWLWVCGSEFGEERLEDWKGGLGGEYRVWALGSQLHIKCKERMVK